MFLQDVHTRVKWWGGEGDLPSARNSSEQPPAVPLPVHSAETTHTTYEWSLYPVVL